MVRSPRQVRRLDVIFGFRRAVGGLEGEGFYRPLNPIGYLRNVFSGNEVVSTARVRKPILNASFWVVGELCRKTLDLSTMLLVNRLSSHAYFGLDLIWDSNLVGVLSIDVRLNTSSLSGTSPMCQWLFQVAAK